MSEIELPVVDEVKILRLRPDDTIVCRVERHLADDEFTYLGANLKRCFPDNRVAILDGGATLEVLRAEDGEVTDEQHD